MPKMNIREVTFLTSYAHYKQITNFSRPEIAFIGRSNVGKSSLINTLCLRKDIAKVSNTTGKTQLINFFDVNEDWFLVDLPGYGYARTSKQIRKSFQSMITDYLSKHRMMACAFVLLDIRHELQKIDSEFIHWLGEHGVPFAIVYTKADKLNSKDVPKHVQRIESELLKTWEELPKSFITSSQTKAGREELLDYIDTILTMVQDQNI